MEFILIGANLIIMAVFLLSFNRLPPQIPLFYSRLWGEDQLADTWMLVFVPIFINGLFFLNNFVSNRLFSTDTLIKKMVRYLNLFIIIGLTLVFIKIILLVT
ncbi:hypothetical protein GYA28_04650 [Candidatus Roizmanbacteria bacterium]|jgi:hypothetical protein|nr:hypothetical protein [Candidatus Roizmanbacteria bacterium]